MAKSKNIRLLLWLVAIGTLIVVSVVVAVALLLQEGAPGFEDEAHWMHVRFSPQLADGPGNEGMLTSPEDMPPLTSELSAALRHAATDDAIAGLFIEVGSLPGGWAQLQELRSAVQEFTDTGKPCTTWGETYTNREYYLASACGDIQLAPAGLTLVNGLSLTQTYYAQALSELHISANFEHVGDFKSAVEPYERTGPSDAAAEATDALLDSLYGQLLAGIAQGRGITVAEAEALVDDPPMSPDAALARGLVDRLSYKDEALEEVGEERTKLSDYIRHRRREWSKGDTAVAVIYAEGTIVSGESSAELFGGSTIGDRTLAKQLKQVREDEEVAAVVLRVNSPGGSGSASDAIWREVERTRAEKPVVVSMGDYAASGGYYISMSADRIFAEPGTLTGSIGVFGGKLNLSGFYEQWLKMSMHTFSRGEHATLLSANADFDDAGREIYRSFLEGFYTTFVTKAAEGRGMSYEALHAVAQGRVWTGEQALERGLIDELGSTPDAIASAADMAGLTSYRIDRLPERRGFFDQLLEELSNPEASQAQLPASVAQALSTVSLLDRVLSEGGAAAMLPGTIEIH